MTRRSPWASGRGALVASLAHGVALAQPPGPDALGLRWDDPAGLAPYSPAELEARLSERVGRPAFDDAASERVLSVAWRGTAEQCSVQLQLMRGAELEGTRLLESPSGDCRSLGPALLAVAALLIEATETPAGTTAAEAPPAPPEPLSPAPPAAGVEPIAASRDEPFVLLSVGASGSYGFAPRLELGPSVAAFVAPAARVRLGLRAGVFLPQEHGRSPGMELTHAHATAILCAMPLSGEFGLGICGSAGLHRYRSVGISLPYRNDVRTYTPVLGIGARAEWHIVGRLWWVADLGAEVAPSRLSFHYTSESGAQTTVFRQHRAAPMLFLGITSELP